jgi:putative transferase (TIGR04331 family)
MFWNPSHWELNEKAKPYFELLKAAGILHETPESAALQMIMVWDSVESWWESDKVQSARKQFVDQYSQTPENYFEKLQVFFEEAVDHGLDGQKT